MQKSPRASGTPEPHWINLLGFLCTILVLVSSFLLPRGGNLWIRMLGVFMLLLASVLMFLPFYYLKKFGGVREGHPYYETTILVRKGLYRLIRHPQYLGYCLLSAGFALLSQHNIVIILAVTAIILFYIYTVKEEAFCLKRLGEPYRIYMRQVPRFNIITGFFRLFFNDSSSDKP